MERKGVRNVVEIFNRDIKELYKNPDMNWRIRVLNDAIQFYLDEMSLPAENNAKIFSDYEYRLIIKLYQHELSLMLIDAERMALKG